MAPETVSQTLRIWTRDVVSQAAQSALIATSLGSRPPRRLGRVTLLYVASIAFARRP